MSKIPISLLISDLGNGIMVQGNDNRFFPDNATLTFPYNSVIVVTDDSEMATFRSAANNDVLFSALIGAIEIDGENVTKQDINVKFNAIANQSSGGGGDVTGLFADADYDSITKHINFYDIEKTLVTYIDATDFIKDGMVQNVEISGGNLVITFNTDAGKQPISIPLTDIFNPANYYDKTATDTLLAAKTDSSSLATVATSGDYDDLSNKPTIPTVPTNVSAFTNDAGYLTQHQSLDNYYTKTQVDTELSAKVDQTEFDTKEEVVSTALNELEENKQDKLTAGQNITIQNNVISATGGTQVQSDWNQSDSTAVDYIKNKPTIPDTSDFVTKAEYNPKEVAIANALTDLNENKADKSDTYTKSQVDTALADKANSSDLATVATSGDYDDLNNKPTIPAAQVNSDWNASSGVAEILNKPDLSIYAQSSTLATVATSGSYNDLSNKPTIPVVPTNVSAFTNDAGYLTQHQSLDNYYTKTQVDTALAAKVSKTEFDTKEEVISTALNTLNGNFGGMKLMRISSADYEALQTKDSNTLYIITGSNS